MSIDPNSPDRPIRASEISESIVGKFTFLKPVGPADYDFLYHVATAGRSLVTWRFRGQTPSPEQFSNALWQGVLTQFVGCQKDTGTPVCHVSAYAPDFRNGIVYLAVALQAEYEGFGWSFEPAVLFVDYLFQCFPLRKIYIEAFEFNFERFASGAGRFFKVEGRLEDYEFHDGVYWDKFIASIDRSTWDEVSARLRF